MLLDCGVEVAIDRCWFSPSYEGLVLGFPDQEGHMHMLAQLTDWMRRRLEIQCHMHQVPQEPGQLPDGRVCLPAFQCGVYLVSSNSGNHPNADGTHMSVCFFADDLVSRPLAEVVREKLQGVDWLSVASPYWI